MCGGRCVCVVVVMCVVVVVSMAQVFKKVVRHLCCEPT